MTIHYSNVIPIRFSDLQLAQIDAQASKENRQRSTLIREYVLKSIETEKPLAS